MTRPAQPADAPDAPDAPDMFARDCIRAAHALAFCDDPGPVDSLTLTAAHLLLAWAHSDADYRPLTQRHGSNGALRAAAYVPFHSPPVRGPVSPGPFPYR